MARVVAAIRRNRGLVRCGTRKRGRLPKDHVSLGEGSKTTGQDQGLESKHLHGFLKERMRVGLKLELPRKGMWCKLGQRDLQFRKECKEQILHQAILKNKVLKRKKEWSG